MLKSFLMQMYVGPSHVVSAEIAVAMAVLIENPADYDVQCVIRFLQADEILGYLAEEQGLAWNCSVAQQRASAYCPADTSLTVGMGSDLDVSDL